MGSNAPFSSVASLNLGKLEESLGYQRASFLAGSRRKMEFYPDSIGPRAPRWDAVIAIGRGYDAAIREIQGNKDYTPEAKDRKGQIARADAFAKLTALADQYEAEFGRLIATVMPKRQDTGAVDTVQALRDLEINRQIDRVVGVDGEGLIDLRAMFAVLPADYQNAITRNPHRLVKTGQGWTVVRLVDEAMVETIELARSESRDPENAARVHEAQRAREYWQGIFATAKSLLQSESRFPITGDPVDAAGR